MLHKHRSHSYLGSGHKYINAHIIIFQNLHLGECEQQQQAGDDI